MQKQTTRKDEGKSRNFINLGIVLNKKGEVLMIRRAKEEIGKDGTVLRWVFPGGGQRKSETREECLKREMLEETGYAIEPAGKIALRVHPQFPVVIAYHLCYLTSEKPVAEPSEPHEVAEIKWMKPDEVSGVTRSLHPAVKKVIGIKDPK